MITTPLRRGWAVLPAGDPGDMATPGEDRIGETLARAEAAIAAADAWHAGDAPLRVSWARLDTPTASGGESAPRAPRGVRGSEELVEAARWWLEHVVLPPQRGFAKVKERDGFTCQNPECRRKTLRVEAHHEQPRALGGDDDPGNLLSACRPCHLRGIHTGTAERPPRITTAKVRVGDTPAILWTFAGGRQTLQLRAELDPPGGGW